MATHPLTNQFLYNLNNLLSLGPKPRKERYTMAKRLSRILGIILVVLVMTVQPFTSRPILAGGNPQATCSSSAPEQSYA